jgi:hypothetical protein
MLAASEAEITEFLGRERYQRAAVCDEARPGSRNGYREVTVKTTAGPVTWPGRNCAARRRSSPPGFSAAMSPRSMSWNRW